VKAKALTRKITSAADVEIEPEDEADDDIDLDEEEECSVTEHSGYEAFYQAVPSKVRNAG
jgi:23S rRNA A2030 N6-methylase RlmJ